MNKKLLTVISATVFLVSSALPSSADYYRRGGGYGYGGGGGWHGGGWNRGAGAALGLGLGLGVLCGAFATAPYYSAPLFAHPRYGPLPTLPPSHCFHPHHPYY